MKRSEANGVVEQSFERTVHDGCCIFDLDLLMGGHTTLLEISGKYWRLAAGKQQTESVKVDEYDF